MQTVLFLSSLFEFWLSKIESECNARVPRWHALQMCLIFGCVHRTVWHCQSMFWKIRWKIPQYTLHGQIASWTHLLKGKVETKIRIYFIGLRLRYELFIDAQKLHRYECAVCVLLSMYSCVCLHALSSCYLDTLLPSPSWFLYIDYCVLSHRPMQTSSSSAFIEI